MPIISRKPTAPPDIKPTVPAIVSPQASSVVVDTQSQPRSTLVAYVEGAIYTVDYYSQVLTENSGLYAHDPSRSALNQPFKKISRLEIRLTQPLSSQQNEQDKTFVVRGAGHITHGVIPNEGDMFAADVGDGREGIFQVNSSEMRSIFKDSVYHVEFQLLFFSKNDQARRDDLENKVAARYHYIRDFARWGQNPIVSDGRYKSLQDLQVLYSQMIEHYFDWFYSRDRGTFLVPGQQGSVYDPNVVATMHAIIPVRDFPKIQSVRQWSIDDDNLVRQPNLFTALLKRDEKLLIIANRKMGTVDVGAFTNYAPMRSLRYSGMDRIVYPIKQNASADGTRNGMDRTATVEPLLPVPSLYGNVEEMIRPPAPPFAVQIPEIHPVLIDDNYVLSLAFYTSTAQVSLLEKLTRDYLQGEGINPEHLHYLASNYFAWGGLERFYYIPILIILTQSLLRDSI